MDRSKIIRYSASNSIFEFSLLSTVGDRSEQQDSFGYSLKDDGGIILICDGMGGHSDGSIASSIAVDMIINAYRECSPNEDVDGLMLQTLKDVDNRIHFMANEDGGPSNAGTTSVGVIIEKDDLKWFSVGDSRAYIFRNGEFAQLTKDHNYKTVLEEQREVGVIGETEYLEGLSRGEQLINYLGIGNLSLIDYSISPFKIKSGDVIMVMSDGLYRLVSNTEINRYITRYKNTAECLEALEACAEDTSKVNQVSRDNMTIFLISIK